MAYIARKYKNPGTIPDLLVDKPYSKANGSVIMELVMCPKWEHVLMDQEKALINNYCKDAWKGTPAASVLVEKNCTNKDGIEAYKQAKAQYAGPDKWKGIRDEAKTLLQTTIYYGTGKYTLESHVTFQKNQFAKIESYNNHVNATYHDDKSKVSVLLDTINCNDQSLATQKETVLEDTNYSKDYNKV